MEASLLLVASLILLVMAVFLVIALFPHCGGSAVPGDIVALVVVAWLLVLVAEPLVMVWFFMVAATRRCFERRCHLLGWHRFSFRWHLCFSGGGVVCRCSGICAPLVFIVGACGGGITAACGGIVVLCHCRSAT